jgi:hypothetical protein
MVRLLSEGGTMYPEDYYFSLLIEQALIQSGLKPPGDNNRKLNLPLCLFSAVSIILGLVFLGFLNR